MHVSHVSSMGIIAVASAVGAAAPAARALDGAVFPITEVGLLETGGSGGAVIKDIWTPFGMAAIRPADFVVNGRSWRDGRVSNRVPRALTDLDLSTLGGDDGPLATEMAVMYGRGFDELKPGPDVFLISSPEAAQRIVVAPVYRMPDETLVEGDAVTVVPDASPGAVRGADRRIAGAGIDLDAWRTSGQAPAGAVLVGAVIRPENEGEQLRPIEVVLGESLQAGFEEPRNYWRPPHTQGAAHTPGLPKGGGGGANPGFRGDPAVDDVPSPGTAVVLGLAGLAGLRRRR